MSRQQQDQFIDEDEDVCPLCVEEFDIQDRNFKPCPCGYQICQFCFNNIRQNLNGLCPACRREYKDDTIEYKAITAEEMKAEEAKKKRVQNERRKHEIQKREMEALSRKHLSGLRVIQKNLVYVTGLGGDGTEDQLLGTLRGENYFGQYGKILKIVVNRRTTAQGTGGGLQSNDSNSQGVGVYVTFSNKSEAQKCIAAVDGTENGGRILRATYGTTKYCSTYLRNETCTNKNCMFLHEPGEDADSFSRMELSTANSRQTREQAQAQLAPPPQPPVAAAAPPAESHPPPNHHPLVRMNSNAGSSAAVDTESSALPSTANWAKNPPTPASRPASLVHQISHHQVPNGSPMPSPKGRSASPMAALKAQENGKTGATRSKPPLANSMGPPANPNGNSASTTEPQPAEEPKVATASPSPPPPPPPSKPAEPQVPLFIREQIARLEKYQKAVSSPAFKFVLSKNVFTQDEYDALLKIPPMFDKHGGRRRREMLEKMKLDPVGDSVPDEQRLERATQPPPPPQLPSGGGLSSLPINIPGLGFNPSPQEQFVLKESPGQQQQPQGLGAFTGQDNFQARQQPQQQVAAGSQTPQNLAQQANQQAQLFGAFQSGAAGIQGPQQQPQQQQQSQPQQQGQGGQHARHSSRYTFTNDNNVSAATTVNARGNQAHMAEQARMMPQQQQQQIHPHMQFYGAGAPGLGSGNVLSSVQQPPPGLKSAPTPPAPGLGGIPMSNLPGLSSQFSGLGLNARHATNDPQNVLLRELMRGNAGPGMGDVAGGLMRGGDGKLDLGDPSILQARVAQPQQHQMQHHQGIQAGGGQGQGNLRSPLPVFEPPTGPSSSQVQFHTTSSAPPRKLTPGVVDEDFPALAPASTPRLPAAKPIVAVPSVVKKEKEKATAKVKEKEVKDILEQPANANDQAEASPLPSASAAKEKPKPAKPKPVLAPVITSTAALKEKDKENKSVESSATASAPLSSSYAISATPSPALKQGPKMMRILSKDSNTSIKTAASGIGKSTTPSIDDDGFSITSSRPVSPMPHKELPRTGPATADIPVPKVKSKSALKKERIAAMKEKERLEQEEAKRLELEKGEVHAPVVGRLKKKEKKKRNAKGGVDALDDGIPTGESAGRASPVPTTNSHQDDGQHDSVDEKAEGQAAPEEPKPVALTAAQILAELQNGGEIDFKVLEMFRLPVVGLRSEHISSDEIQKIRASIQMQTAGISPSSDGKKKTPGDPSSPPTFNIEPGAPAGSVHLSLRGGGTFETRMLVTPEGTILRGLTTEQECRFLEMEERRRTENSYERWKPVYSSEHPPPTIPSASTTLDGEDGKDSSSWKAAVAAHTVAAGIAAAGTVAKNMQLGGPEEATRLSTKEALDYLWNTVMPALPGYAQEQLEGLAQSMASGGCKVSVGFDHHPAPPHHHHHHTEGVKKEGMVTVDVKVEGAPGASSTASLGKELGVSELEKLVSQARKETEGWEKKVEKLVKRNRKIVGLI